MPRRVALLLSQLLLLLNGDALLLKGIKAKKVRRALLRKKTQKRLLRPAPFPLVPPGLPLLVGGAAVAAAAAAPVGGYLSVMGAPVYGQGLLPGTGGLLDFDTLSPRVSTNEYLVAPPDRCLDFVASETGGGGGGARRGGDAPQYDVPVDELQRTFLAMVEELYILKEYAQPTTASKPDERRFVFVQRTPLLRFPDVINVAFLALPSPQLEEEGVEFDLSAGRSTLIIHSGSVFGFDDIGKNRERVAEWLQRLDDAIASKVSSSSSSALTTEATETEAEETIMEAEETMMEAEDAEVVAGEDEDEVAAEVVSEEVVSEEEEEEEGDSKVISEENAAEEAVSEEEEEEEEVKEEAEPDEEGEEEEEEPKPKKKKRGRPPKKG